MDRWVPELFLISLLAAFCGGLAWIHDHELFAAAFAAAAVVAASQARPRGRAGRGRLGQKRTEMTTTRTHFTFRVAILPPRPPKPPPPRPPKPPPPPPAAGIRCTATSQRARPRWPRSRRVGGGGSSKIGR